MVGRRHYKRRMRRDPRPFRERPAAYVVQWVLCGIAITVFLGLFIRYMEQSEMFAVRWVHIEGTRILDPQTVLDASGLTMKDNLLFLHPARICERVEALPYVKHCSLSRVFPDRVTLFLEERAPVATLLLDNRQYELDPEGVPIRELAAEESHPGPLITNAREVVFVELGVKIDDDAVQSSLRVWDAFSRVPMARDVTVSELAAFGKDAVFMFCEEIPFEIRWGRSDFNQQARRLNILWEQKGRHLDCQEYLELRFDRDLICK